MRTGRLSASVPWSAAFFPAMVETDRLPALRPDRRMTVTTPTTTRGSRSGGQTSLPPVVEGLLLDMVADGFVLYCCGRRADPTALIASYDWEHFVDILTIRDFDRVTAARVPAPDRGRVDVLAPETVVWAYEGPPQWALRALLNLLHPQHPDAPTVEYPAPPRLRIPRDVQRPLTIRPPSPGRAGVRAARLTAAMAVEGADPFAATLDLPARDHQTNGKPSRQEIAATVRAPMPGRKRVFR